MTRDVGNPCNSYGALPILLIRVICVLFAVTNFYSHQPQLPRNSLHRLNAERDAFF